MRNLRTESSSDIDKHDEDRNGRQPDKAQRQEKKYGSQKRPLTINTDRITDIERGEALSVLLTDYREELQWLEENRPRTRGDCEKILRPCPFVSCKYNLYLDVDPETGSIKLNYPDKGLDELETSCALDVAERKKSGMTLEEVGEIMNLTRERIRQLGAMALLKAQATFLKMGCNPKDESVFAPKQTFVRKSGNGNGKGSSHSQAVLHAVHDDHSKDNRWENDGSQDDIYFPDDITKEW